MSESLTTHKHVGSACPFQSKRHGFCPPQPGDSRSVCPVLNAMANHGYIPRDGRKLSVTTLIRGVCECFGLSFFLASLLITVTMISVGRLWRADLFDLGRHNRIEHNASLVHADTPNDDKYAPNAIQQEMVKELMGDIQPRPERLDQGVVGVVDMARMRIRREKLSPPLGAFHSEIARGELALLWGIFGTSLSPVKPGIPLPWFVTLLGEERLPDGWYPDHTQGLLDTVKRSQSIRAAVKVLENQEDKL